MKLFVFVLNKTEKLEELLAEFMRVGISGSTVISSMGMARVLNNYSDEDLPFLGSIRMILYPEREKNNTIFTVLKDDQVQDALHAIEKVVGDIQKSDTGIMFTVPIDFAKGF
ncbi:MAG: hypothetical protein R2876_02520 [Eubacteriales bacterium]